MTRRTTWAALTLVAGLLSALVVTAPAEARVPLATDDTFKVYTGAEYLLDPLANDTEFPFGNPLTLCGFELDPADEAKVYVEISDNQLFLEANPGATGSVVVSYTACSGDQSDTAEAKIQLRRLRDLVGTVRSGTRSRVQFRNSNNVDVTVQWGDVSTGKADGSRVVPAGSTVVVKVSRRQIYWLGYLRDGDVVVTVGDGVIRRITQPTR